MPDTPDHDARLDSPDAFINRELSWLDFNFRVLAEAENPDVPVLDRLKFIAIVSSNLDEFFTVRVARLKRLLARGEKTSPTPDGMSPASTLDAIRRKSAEMLRRQYAALDDEIVPRLQAEGIHIVREPAYTPEDRDALRHLFDEQISPTLTPMAVDPGHPFPLLASGAIYLIFRIHPREELLNRFYSQTDTVLVQVPKTLSRFIPLPAPTGQTRLAVLNDVITLFADRLLGGYHIEGAYPFRVLRDAEMEVDEETEDDLLGVIHEALRSRKWGVPVRLEIWTRMPEAVQAYLVEQLGIADGEDIAHVPSLLGLKDLFAILDRVDRPDLLEKPWLPQEHPVLSRTEDFFQTLREGDHILNLPYQTFDPVVRMVSLAADDPDVLAIKITLYRVSGKSPLVRALVRAAENGKQVTALVELRARFDEEANIGWARRLDAAGAHVIYGVVGYKTHSKVCLVVRRERDGIQRYVHLATGNYNDKTARLYTDVGLFTARSEFGADVSGFFNVITGYSLPPRWHWLTMAPTDLRRRLLALIEREIETHTPEAPGRIRAKLNSLIDPEIIRALYRASQAGVEIDLLVRGLCRLRARVPGLSETIRVRSILDRFLEHPRIIHFRNGGNEEVYLSSADWMERNFDTRLELLFPILDEACRGEVLAILDSGFADTMKAWEMDAEGVYHRVPRPEDESRLVRGQAVLYQRARDAARSGKRSPAGTFKVRTRPE